MPDFHNEGHWWYAPFAYHVFYIYLIDILLATTLGVLNMVYMSNKWLTFVKVMSLISTNLVVLWRFESPKKLTSSQNYLKLLILLKREERCKVAAAIILIFLGISTTTLSLVGFVQGEPLSTKNEVAGFTIYSAILLHDVIFVTIKVKYAVYFCSRALQATSCLNCISFIMRFLSLIELILTQSFIHHQEYTFCYFIAGALTLYIGIHLLLVCYFIDDAKFWLISWWNTAPNILQDENVDPNTTTEERWNDMIKNNEFSFLWFQPKNMRDFNVHNEEVEPLEQKNQTRNFSNLWGKDFLRENEDKETDPILKNSSLSSNIANDNIKNSDTTNEDSLDAIDEEDSLKFSSLLHDPSTLIKCAEDANVGTTNDFKDSDISPYSFTNKEKKDISKERKRSKSMEDKNRESDISNYEFSINETNQKAD